MPFVYIFIDARFDQILVKTDKFVNILAII